MIITFIYSIREYSNYILQITFHFRNKNIFCLHKTPQSAFQTLFYQYSVRFFEVIGIF